MICYNCGCPIPANEKACRNCGSPVNDTPDGGRASISCTQCGGAMIYDETKKAHVCPHCGNETAEAAQKTNSVSLTDTRLEQLRSSGSFRADGNKRDTEYDKERLAKAAGSVLSGVGKGIAAAIFNAVIGGAFILAGLGLLIYAATLLAADNKNALYIGAGGVVIMIVGVVVIKRKKFR